MAERPTNSYPRIKLSGQRCRGNGRRSDRYGNTGGDLIVEAFGRWVRFAAYFGTPPGSHIGLWRTRGGFSGEMHGINLRVGRRYIGPCLTVFVHTRRSR